MQKRERYKAFIDYFITNQPDADTELTYGNPYELLVAVILSAQCTDKRVNMVTPLFFEAFPTVQDLALSSFDQVFPYIKSISYPNNKTKHLIGMAKMLVNDFRGIVPDSIQELQKLPGVGRKTANVVANVIYNQPTMAVDTHVFRVSKRLGLVNQSAKTPLEVEKQLLKYIPQKHLNIAHHWLILHGRYVCLARKPKCLECKITHICRYYQKNIKPLSI
ncbi:MAG: endonuclease III [Candidatus Cyclobacteriaceae bacterium M3_2C_046]